VSVVAKPPIDTNVLIYFNILTTKLQLITDCLFVACPLRTLIFACFSQYLLHWRRTFRFAFQEALTCRICQDAVTLAVQ